VVCYGPLPAPQLRINNSKILEQEAIDMKVSQRTAPIYSAHNLRAATSRCRYLAGLALTIAVYLFCFVPNVSAQTPILTQHYDTGRTGQNTGETILTTSNVNSVTFGKLFSLSVVGYVYAQPLYVPGVAVAGQGTHNVLYVATEHDLLYAFDADTGGAPLWQVNFVVNGGSTVPNGNVNTGDIVPEIGITGTPVIDQTSKTLYVVSKTLESGAYILRLHAIDITSGAEKFGGPTVMTASVPGTGSGSTSGTLTFSSQWENQRPGLLLINGYVYVGFAAHGDNGPWHGWILSYNASTMKAAGAWCTSPNGIGSGLWASGSGLAADSSGTGRIFVATGNGDYPVTSNVVPNPAPAPSTSVDFGDSLVQLTLSSTGAISPTDYFTPYNTSSLDGADTDLGSGGVIIPPDQAGTFPHVLVESGKQGRLYIVNRDKMTSDGSHFCNGCSTDPEIINTVNGIGGLWSMPAYWNGNMYFWGNGDHLKAYSFTNGNLSASQTSESAETSGFPGATPVVSSSGTSNGIVWAVQTDQYTGNGAAILHAYNATNVSNELYASNATSNPDTLGPAVKFVVPVVTNGKVYVGTQQEVDVFGLLTSEPRAATPSFSPAGGSYASSVQVTISDSTANSTIYYTTNGTTPTTASTKYTAPVSITATTTLQAIAVATGFLQSASSMATYTIATQTAAPSLTPAPGTYTSTQMVTLTDPGATIYYTTNGTTPTHNSAVYTGPIVVSSTTTVMAIGSQSGLSDSGVATGIYTINSGATTSINFGLGFSNPVGMQFNGTTDLDDSRLQLTSGGLNQAGSAFFNTPMDIRNFTTDFTFQISDAVADGMTFTIQNSSAGAKALGPSGGGLGYGPDAPGGTPGIGNSIAVKFDIYNNAGEGDDSTGLYTNGASPTQPSTDLTPSGIVLFEGDTITAHITYDGTTLTMTLTDQVISKTFTESWTINIPSTIGGNTAFVGFTGGTGGSTSSQKVETWTFVSTPPQAATVATPQITPGSETFSGSLSVMISDSTSGAGIYYTTDGSTPSPGVGTTKQYSTAFTVSATTTVNAIATLQGDNSSAIASAVYTLQASTTPTVNYAGGFTTTGGLQFNGTALWKQTAKRLTLTNAAATTYQAGTVFYTTPVNIQAFTNDFTFQLTNASADGFTFTIQNNSATALGANGGALGYATIAKSVAVKFDLYNNSGEGADSTGEYTGGAMPTTPFTDLTSSGVNLHSGDVMSVHMTYDGTTLSMTITDSTAGKSFSTSWPVNIPTAVGGSTAYVGFTGGAGALTATQEIATWSYTAGAPTANTPIVYQTENLLSSSVSSGPTYRAFAWTGFTNGNGTTLDSTKVGDSVAITLNVPAAGTYDVKYAVKKYVTRGISQLAVNGTNLGPTEDQYSSVELWAEFDMGTVTLAAGNQVFKFTVTGKNAASSSSSLSWDYIKLTPQ
jgi:hypothetical protein